MTTKRAYKLQEFVAHASNVNCLKIGRKTSRILVTGGEDQKVNLWAIGKPNALLSLSGHISPVDSVSFDSSEVLVAAGAAGGTIKLWDLEEAKIVRTLTGHRSNCISIDFHPFGEFFASGSLDTNLKIWDIRRKGCIHTYKGHTRGVNVLRFTPDGRWVVSGGEDNAVKIWDLTAGKLLHDFKFHEGQIQCIDFHPHEFLLATGSADKTVKFWDLETFELIGSSGPETSGVRSLTFNSDGRTLFCGLHESLKVLSWEPIRYHDVVDVGWSRLTDLNVHEGKLLGCSYNQSCVGIWVVDLSRIEPYAVKNDESKSTTGMNVPMQTDNSITISSGRSSVSKISASSSASGTPLRVDLNSSSKMVPSTTGATLLKKNSSKNPGATNPQITSKSNVVSASPPRISSRLDAAVEYRKETTDLLPSAVPHSSSRGDLIANSVKEARKVVPVIVPRISSDSCKETTNELPANIPRVSLRGDLAADPSKESRDVKANPRVDFPNNPRKEGNVIPVIVPRSSSRRDLASDSSNETSRPSTRLDLSVDPEKEISDISPTVARTSLRRDLTTDSGRPSGSGRSSLPYAMRSKLAGSHRISSIRDDSEREIAAINTCSMVKDDAGSSEFRDLFTVSVDDNKKPVPATERNLEAVRVSTAGMYGANRLVNASKSYNIGYRRTRSPAASWDRNENASMYEGRTSSYASGATSTDEINFSRGRTSSAGRETVSASDEDAIADLAEQHGEFLTTGQSRLTKLQVVHRLWQKNDVRGVINAMQRMSDNAVSADVVSVLMEKSDIITLDLCTSLLPLITGLLESRFDRHLGIALDMLLKLVKSFGPLIHSAISAAPLVGVDLEAEQRLERCNLCFIELEKLKTSLLPITRRGGSIGKSAQELNLALQDVFSATN
ncbi:katanin p80 WD40 repeat-containing subunit B1 homolog [Ananas comosus]|uniref:Katanin p80 WD40 repeat-containing subunit B1 homolog n=2 Tax=Ananas comosus TaxID=4615 RepID=A0A6P5FFE0_ANACO|nr:katanin p80 WD40 repeat-containing subunit B1 homolog [Ananas comosus]